MRLASALAVPALAALALAASACGDPAAHDPAPGEHDAGESGGHHHAAPHGGVLVEVEHEGLNVELLLDATTGTVTAWVLDGCAEHSVRIAQESIPLSISVGGAAFALELRARESSLTGEKPGDASEFSGQDDRLRGAKSFEGTIRSLAAAGRTFQSVPLRYAPGHP